MEQTYRGRGTRVILDREGLNKSQCERSSKTNKNVTFCLVTCDSQIYESLFLVLLFCSVLLLLLLWSDAVLAVVRITKKSRIILF